MSHLTTPLHHRDPVHVRTRLGIVLIAAIMAPALPVSTAVAQLEFRRPEKAVDVSQYRHVEECLAASARVRDSVSAWSGIWTDTLAASDAHEREHMFALSVASASRCAVSLPESARATRDFRPLLTLYLRAGEDEAARDLLEQRISELPSGDDEQLVAVLDTAMTVVLEAAPPRLAFAEDLLATPVYYPAPAWVR